MIGADMTYSMTAFARVQKQLDNSNLCWEIKSVNHRYLEVSFRLPDAFRFLETRLRSMLRNQINRGKIECQLKYQDVSATNQSLFINEGLVSALLQASEQLAKNRHLANDLQVSQLLAWPGVVQLEQTDTEQLSEQVERLFKEAVDQLIEVRQKEGQALKQHIMDRLDSLESQINEAKKYASTMIEKGKEKLFSRLNEIKVDVSETRVDQELALIIARLDVTEELDRLQTHGFEVRRILEKEQVAGRRLDFLMQELNREANTLSSKSDIVELTRCAVEMKVLIEQMREQIQNIE